MKRLNVVFLWHLHQPIYKDSNQNQYILPWVRLHACKAYFDMAALLEKFPEIKANFNLTPSLLIQLKDYVENNAEDVFFEVSKKPAKELTLEDRKFILLNFFMANWDTMLGRFPRYLELLDKRGRFYKPSAFEKIAPHFSDSDFRDLQTLFNLCWFGFMKEHDDREINELIKKGEKFTEEDKEIVLSKQKETMAEIIPLYKKLASRGQIEISTTPFYHPILPLLYNGGRGEGFNFRKDAIKQVEKAISLYQEIFGEKPKGMWPAEGGVSQSIVPILASHGIEWVATDEEILMESLKRRERDDLVYLPYLVRSEDMTLKILFRDKNLSNLISFIYSRNRPEEAASDFIGHLKRIAGALSRRKEENMVAIILDGENPWEHYQGGGEGFLTQLYTRIAREEELECVTISDYLKRADKFEEIKELSSGSWVDHSFRIWIGKPEKDIAWKYLKKARGLLKEDSPPEAWEELYIAEGSDWFWWYGDDFSSANDETFDFLFRSHLMNIYRRLGKEIPYYLQQPILSKGRASLQQEPHGIISPTLDGRVTDYYEWLEAGSFRIDESGGTMYSAMSLLKEIRFGFDINFLYFRFDLSFSPLDNVLSDTCIRIEFSEPVEVSLEIPLGKISEIRVIRKDAEGGEVAKGLSNSYAMATIVEARVPWEEMAFEKSREARFVARVKKEGLIYETWPRNGFISFNCPEKDYELKCWSA